MGTRWVDREARLFRAGDYPSHQFSATTDDLDRAAANARIVPLDLHHADTDETLPMGGIVPGSLRRVGEWLHGTIRLPEFVDTNLKHRNLSVVFDRATKALRKVTITPNPRVAGAAFSDDIVLFDDTEAAPAEPGDLVSFSEGEIMAETPRPDVALSDEQVERVATSLGDRLAALFSRKPREEAPETAPEAPAAFSRADAEALVTEALKAQQAAFEATVTELRGELAKASETAAKTSVEFSQDRCEAAIQHDIRVNRVAPALARLLVPFEQGAEVVYRAKDGETVSFAEGEGLEPLTAAMACREALAFARQNPVGAGGAIPRRDYGNESVSFEDRALKLAAEKAKDPADPEAMREALIAAGRELDSAAV